MKSRTWSIPGAAGARPKGRNERTVVGHNGMTKKFYGNYIKLLSIVPPVAVLTRPFTHTGRVTLTPSAKIRMNGNMLQRYGCRLIPEELAQGRPLPRRRPFAPLTKN